MLSQLQEANLHNILPDSFLFIVYTTVRNLLCNALKKGNKKYQSIKSLFSKHSGFIPTALYIASDV